MIKKLLVLLILLLPGCGQNIYKQKHLEAFTRYVKELKAEKIQMEKSFAMIIDDMKKEESRGAIEIALYHWTLLYNNITLLNAKNSVYTGQMLNLENTWQFITTINTASTEMLTGCLSNYVEMEVFIKQSLHRELELLVNKLNGIVSDRIERITAAFTGYIDALKKGDQG